MDLSLVVMSMVFVNVSPLVRNLMFNVVIVFAMFKALSTLK